MPSYTKLFNSIITSTIWSEDDKTRIIWITMLAMSDKNGEVHASIPGLARVANMTTAEAEMAIGKLMSPDPYSRTPDNEGRRIAKIDGGWDILNHGKYRRMASKEDAKEATADRVRRYRERNAPVTPCNAPVTQDRDIAEADTDTEAEEIPPLPPEGDGDVPKSDPPKPKNIPTSPEAIRIHRLFNRRPGTGWSDKEIRAFKAIGPIDPSDLDAVCAYTESERKKGSEGRHRRDMTTFLNNFRGEVDRAIAAKNPPAKTAWKPNY